MYATPQVVTRCGIFIGMKATSELVERVRCLACGSAYAKPAGGGTLYANPGCPACGYLGWVQHGEPFRPGEMQRRFVAGHLQRRTG
jgi:hypothetical protein